MIYGVSGHRNFRGPLLDHFATAVVEQRRPSGLILGMALGWDLALAKAAIQASVSFVAALPFVGQESRWSPKDQAAYRFCLRRAEMVHVVRPDIGDQTNVIRWHHAAIGAYFERDDWIIAQGHPLLAFWDGRRRGGTYHTVETARAARREIINEYDAFLSGGWLV